jgi:hypothetical protein
MIKGIRRNRRLMTFLTILFCHGYLFQLSLTTIRQMNECRRLNIDKKFVSRINTIQQISAVMQIHDTYEKIRVFDCSAKLGEC